MFRLIAIDFSQKSPHFSLLSHTSSCELSEREVTSPSNLKVVGALDNQIMEVCTQGIEIILLHYLEYFKTFLLQVIVE
jgi:hypothetical protein